MELASAGRVVERRGPAPYAARRDVDSIQHLETVQTAVRQAIRQYGGGGRTVAWDSAYPRGGDVPVLPDQAQRLVRGVRRGAVVLIAPGRPGRSRVAGKR
ncbi:hypothetical protein AB5J72_04970 [Streptomyces sp. CG1]|uniref:hypothetical protein n=1 Tax=Streptomyces sp. CG1 TaxID=1287523 RepID=UPI0034E30207